MSNETKRDVFEEFADECAGLNDEGTRRITDADRVSILKAAGFVRIKKEKDNEQ